MKVGIGIVVLALIAFGLYMYVVSSNNPTAQDETLKTYSSEKYGLSFSYPRDFYLEEKELGNGERGHYLVMLYEDTEENKNVREGNAPGREGPVSINIDIYQNDLDRMSAENWIRNTNDSNFKMSPDGVLTPYSVGGLDGFLYHWSGLYEAVAFAASNERFVYSFTVTYITPQDPIRDVFDSVIESVIIR